MDIDHHSITARRMVDAGFALVQDGDHEKTFTFDVIAFDTVAAIVPEES